MRSFRFACLLLLAPLWGSCALSDPPVQAGASGTYETLQAECKELLSAGVQGNIAVLTRLYPAVTNADVREAIAATIGIYWLTRQELPESERYSEYLKKNFPGSGYQSLFEKDIHLAACTNCNRSGIAPMDCPACGGTGKCRACGGRGKVTAITSGGSASLVGGATERRAFGGATTRTTGSSMGTQPTGGKLPIGGAATPTEPCAICAGTGTCKACQGSKQVKGPCARCHGTGTVFTQQARVIYTDLLLRLRTLARAAALAERGQFLFDGRWVDRATRARLLEQRRDDRAFFARVTGEAESARQYEQAVRILDNALARRPESVYTGDVQRIRALIRSEAADKTPKELLGPERRTAAESSARQDIPGVVQTILDASRRGTNAPAYLFAPGPVPALPISPLRWKIGEPEGIDRTARATVQVDRPSRTGFAIPETWVFLLYHEDTQWKVWQTIPPQPEGPTTEH
jgi:hypothetical protein